MSQINNLKYYNKVTRVLKWACKLPRKTETYESAKYVPFNTRKCTHNGSPPPCKQTLKSV